MFNLYYVAKTDSDQYLRIHAQVDWNVSIP